MACLPKRASPLFTSFGNYPYIIQRHVLPHLARPVVASAAGTDMARSSQVQHSATQDNLDDIMDVLKDAFGAAAAQTRTTAPQGGQQAIQSPGAGFASSKRTSSRAASSSARALKGSKGTGMTLQPTETSTEQQDPVSNGDGMQEAPRSISKKRKGPFADLVSAIEQDIKQHATQASSSSSIDSSSRRGESPVSSTVSSQDMVNSSSQTSSPSGTRRSTRRIRSQQTPEQHPVSTQQQPSQQQQRTARIKSQQTPEQHPAPTQQQPSALQEQIASQQQQRQQQQEPDWLQHPLVTSLSKKHFKPVYKGDLALPGGPAWSGLRRHVCAAGSNAELPTLDCIVIVEGDQDQRAVARAVNAPVYVCDGTRALKDHVKPELEMLQLLGRPLVVLTDPDERGRELRLHLDDLIGPLSHAFIPEQQGTSAVDGPVHAAGNRGIEHAVPGGVRQALRNCRQSYPKDRAVWTQEKLVEMGLANTFDAGESAAGRGVAARRRELCAALGLGRCNGGQLVVLLNRLFDEQTLEAALAVLDGDAQP